MIFRINDKKMINNLETKTKLIELDNECFFSSDDKIYLNNKDLELVNDSDPYFFVTRKYRPLNKPFKVNNLTISTNSFLSIGGPCSIESAQQLKHIVEYVKENNTNALRAGAFKPRTSPYAFQGLHVEGLEIAHELALKNDLPLVSEFTSSEQIIEYGNLVDIIQIGARNMQNFDLLQTAARTQKPILLKRGFSATLDEFLGAAEYIMCEGNDKIILCERGIRTFESSYRSTTDLNGIVLLKKLSHLPVIIDASHSTGIASMVSDVVLGCIGAGVDGMIIETHYDPAHALSDGAQSLNEKEYQQLMKQTYRLYDFMKEL